MAVGIFGFQQYTSKTLKFGCLVKELYIGRESYIDIFINGKNEQAIVGDENHNLSLDFGLVQVEDQKELIINAKNIEIMRVPLKEEGSILVTETVAELQTDNFYIQCGSSISNMISEGSAPQDQVESVKLWIDGGNFKTIRLNVNSEQQSEISVFAASLRYKLSFSLAQNNGKYYLKVAGAVNFQKELVRDNGILALRRPISFHLRGYGRHGILYRYTLFTYQ